jgi:hypothetical protein
MNKLTFGIVIIATVLSFLMLLTPSCKKTTPATCDGSNPTYESEIKDIINANCNSSSCHASGSSNGDLTTFAKLKSYLDNGKFKSEVLDKQSMPKGGAKLTSAQLGKITCWKDNGYPEK